MTLVSLVEVWVLLDTKGAAQRIGVGPNTLEKWRCLGTGPRFVKLGRAVRYREQSLEDWVAAREIGSTSEAVPA